MRKENLIYSRVQRVREEEREEEWKEEQEEEREEEQEEENPWKRKRRRQIGWRLECASLDYQRMRCKEKND